MPSEKDKNKDVSSASVATSAKEAKPAAASVSAAKGTVAKHFNKSETRPYLLDAFCVMHKLMPKSEISESDFSRKLKEFQNRKIG